MQSQNNERYISVLRPELVDNDDHQEMFFWWLEDVAEPESEPEPEGGKESGEGQEPGEGEPGEDSDADNEGDAQDGEDPADGEGDVEPDGDGAEAETEQDDDGGDSEQDELADAKGDATKDRPEGEEEVQRPPVDPNDVPETAASDFFANGGPQREITAKGSNNAIIRSFISKIKLTGGQNTKPKGVHPKKALVALVKAPHTVFDQKKMPRIAPKMYAIIDSWESYYNDGGKLLEEFAETCTRYHVEVWRAEKLHGTFVRKGKEIEAQSHVEFARKASIPANSVVIFVGDGCLGGSSASWKQRELVQFKQMFRPLWINPFPDMQTCGCAPKTLAHRAKWTLVNGITDARQLKNVVLTSL